MAFKLLAIISLIGIATAGIIVKEAEHEVPAEYEFSYAVHDEHTGDIKSQKESRKGDVVQGYYELIEPDGHKRHVEYSVHGKSGFNAVVHREETNIKIPQPAPQKILAPVAHYSVPVKKVTYTAAPITKVITAPLVAKTTHYSDGHENSHVTFNGPAHNYHY